MNAITPATGGDWRTSNIKRLIPEAVMRRINTDPHLAQTKQLFGSLSDPANDQYSWLAKPGMAKDVLRQYMNALPTANGRDVKTVRHAAGAFRMIGLRQWIEEDSKGVRKFSFAEESRDDASVILFDPGRNYRVRLDLRQRQIQLAVGASQFSPLYAITEASSTEGGNSTPAAP